MTHPLDELLGAQAPFVEQLLAEAKNFGLNLPQDIDHFCYRAATNGEYLRLRELLTASERLLVEGIIGGRPIASYQLTQPLQLSTGITIEVLELAAPKAGAKHRYGLEHIEIVTADFAGLIAQNPELKWDCRHQQDVSDPEIALALPSGSIKFHCVTLADKIATEITQQLVVKVPHDYFLCE